MPMAISLVSNRDLGITNVQFLKAVFGEEWGRAHVTAFEDDPSAIPESRRALCWAGGLARDRLGRFTFEQNQYFTISLFHPLEDGRAVRRKAQFDACFVIVADDVREKLTVERCELLPPPSYKMMTSSGSEQWGWILEDPCENADRVNNLLDGLVALGLAPDGVDPGMKGVTRYVRLPEGVNTKAKRFVEGRPFECYIYEWQPERMYAIEQLAECFGVDLDASRGDSGAGQYLGAALRSGLVQNHPIMRHLRVTGEGSDGWIRVDCPNVEAHTDQDPSGAAVQILADGTVHFMCHHGHCNGGDPKYGKLTGGKVVKILAKRHDGLSDEIDAYKKAIERQNALELAKKLEASGLTIEQTSRLFTQASSGGSVGGSAGGVGSVARDSGHGDTLRGLESRQMDGEENSPGGGDQGEGGESDGEAEVEFLDQFRYIYLAPKDKFYDTKTGDLISCTGLDNRYLRLMDGKKGRMKASELLLNNLNRQTEADAMGWFPRSIEPTLRRDLIYVEEGRRYINTWRGFAMKPVRGDVSIWLDHANYLFPDSRQREVVLDYLACIVQRISSKPSFFIAHRGSHRVGKDLFYRGLVEAMGGSCAREVRVDELVNSWGDYRKGLKLVIIPEVDKAQNKQIANMMKTIVAPTSTGEMVLNLKGGAVLTQKDVCAGIMMSNKHNFFAIEKGDLRYYVVDSFIERKEDAWYAALGKWYDQGGAAKVLAYLLDRDISAFNHKSLPELTQGAIEMMDSGRADYHQDLSEMIVEGRAEFATGLVLSSSLRRLRTELRCSKGGLHEALRAEGWQCYKNLVRRVGDKTERIPVFYSNHAQLENLSMAEKIVYFLGQKEDGKVV